MTPQKPLQRAYQRDPEAIERWQREIVPGIARQAFSAASAVNANGAFWFCTYTGALKADLFVTLLRKLMRGRRKPVQLVLDCLPAHKTARVRDYAVPSLT